MVIDGWVVSDSHHGEQQTNFSLIIPLQSKNGWWFQIFFDFHPCLGKIPILTNIFQMG